MIHRETSRDLPTTGSDPLANPPHERALLFSALLRYAISISESQEGIRRTGLDTGEVERRLRIQEDEIWASAGQEEEALRELEKRFSHVEEQLAALRRPPPVLRRLMIIGILALVGGGVLATASPRGGAGNVIGVLIVVAALLVILGVVVTQPIRAAYRLRLRAALRPRSLSAQVAAAGTTFARALLEKGLLPEIRKVVNESLGPEYATGFKYLSAQGLNESSDPRYEVPTQVGQRLQALLARRTGGSIGITGPRGVGKTTLIQAACSGAPLAKTDQGTAWSMVLAAPVVYDSREFILYTFSALCRTVLGPEAMSRGPDSLGWLRPRAPRAGSGGGTPLPMTQSPAADDRLASTTARLRERTQRLLQEIGWARELQRRPNDHDPLLGVIRRLRDEAHGFLQEIEWQQTWTYGWSGAMKFPVPFEMSRTRGGGLSRQPKAFPQVIHDLRTFLSHAAAGGRVIIGVDELDKVESEIEASRFLNDFKALFGIDRCFFVISVSEEAMSSFERRGLPFRDVFDSAFDDILRVPYLRLDDSIRILERRVTGLPVPFLWLCHCLSGGLARDLIRVARALVELDAKPGTELQDVCLVLVQQDLAVKVEAIAVAVRHWPLESDVDDLLLWARQIPGMSGPELLRHCGAFRSVATRSQTESQRNPASPPAGEHHDIIRLGLDLVTFAYLSATVVDVFARTVHADRLMTEEGRKDAINMVEGLAKVRQVLAVNPIMAWQAVSEIRKACQLPDSLPPPPRAYTDKSEQEPGGAGSQP